MGLGAPPPHAPRGRAFLKVVLRIISIVYREFKKDAITLRASAPTYALILSLVPMLALGTAFSKIERATTPSGRPVVRGSLPGHEKLAGHRAHE